MGGGIAEGSLGGFLAEKSFAGAEMPDKASCIVTFGKSFPYRGFQAGESPGKGGLRLIVFLLALLLAQPLSAAPFGSKGAVDVDFLRPLNGGGQKGSPVPA